MEGKTVFCRCFYCCCFSPSTRYGCRKAVAARGMQWRWWYWKWFGKKSFFSFFFFCYFSSLLFFFVKSSNTPFFFGSCATPALKTDLKRYTEGTGKGYGSCHQAWPVEPARIFSVRCLFCYPSRLCYCILLMLLLFGFSYKLVSFFLKLTHCQKTSC